MLDIKNRETLEIYVLGDDFKFYQNLKYLPLTSYPSNNQSALIIYCLGGKSSRFEQYGTTAHPKAMAVSLSETRFQRQAFGIL